MYYQKSANTIHFRNRDFEGREGGGIQNSAAVLFRILLLLVVILVKMQLTFGYLRICDTDKNDTVYWCRKRVHSVSFLNFIVSRTFKTDSFLKGHFS